MQLAKHHGLGNAFLVLIAPEGDGRVDAELARAACAAHAADGLIEVTAPPSSARVHADVAMTLRNADGGRAELSGNGLRCVAQAVVRAGLVPGPGVTVLTDAGPRRATVVGDLHAPTVEVRVEMGPAAPLADGGDDLGARKAMGVSIGNPHRVLLFADDDEVAAAIRAVPANPDVNVELIVEGPEPDAVTMRVVERGVGETLACGTGACAAAWAAHQWGLVGDIVTVHQRGGDAVVEVGDAITLVGPATFEGTVSWP
jgi:diaminopimelate epimerase